MCINAIEKAKKDLAQYKGIFTHEICFGCISEPYIDEIKRLVENKDYKFHIEDMDCVTHEGQTIGCYSGYVNMIMKERFGQNYYQDILDQAKEIYIFDLVNNGSVISIYDLDANEKPRLKNQNIKLINEGIMPQIKTVFPLKITSNISLFLDLKFIIEKDGTVSNCEVNNWVNEYPQNEKFKQDLIDLAMKELKTKYEDWIPGKYDGNVVRTENNLRVHFQ